MNRFDNITKPLMWFMALLLAAFVAGCGGGSSSSTSVPSLLNSAKSIDTFSLAWSTRAPGGTATGTVDQTLKTITVPVPHRANITQLFATFTTSPGVTVTVDSVTQHSGLTQNDYTNPVSYKVTAADGTWATYTVIVNRDQTVTSLAVDPPTASTPKGATYQFAAMATYLDASIDDVTATASWTSAASGVASVGSFDTTGTPGLAKGLAVGTSVITAAFSGKTATADLTVNNAALMSIAITPASGVVAVGSTQQFAATGTYTDGSHPVTATASWTSAASGVASVGSFDTTGTPGLATGLTVGTSDISATIIDSVYGTVSGTAALTVTPRPAPDLLRTASFAVLSTGSTITNAGQTTVNNGNVGATNETIAGTLTVNGGTNDPTCLTLACQNAQADIQTVLDEANSTTAFPCGPSIGGDLSGVALTPGVTCILSNAAISTVASGVVTLNGPGVYIIRTTGSLVPAANSSVAFGTDGTTAATDLNTTVFWVVGSANITSSVGTPVIWKGTILTGGAATLGDSATLINGRVLAKGAVTVTNNTITKP